MKMRFPKNVSKEEQKNSIIQTLEYNTEALDYIQNEINRHEDFLKYKDDSEIRSQLNILKYIHFSLTYLDDTYNKSLILLGASK